MSHLATTYVRPASVIAGARFICEMDTVCEGCVEYVDPRAVIESRHNYGTPEYVEMFGMMVRVPSSPETCEVCLQRIDPRDSVFTAELFI